MTSAPPARRRRAALVLACLAWLGAGGAASAAPVKGFVSGQLLAAWCGRDTLVDRESCYSYLRGIYDTLNAVPATPHGEEAYVPFECMPSGVPIDEIRSVFNRFSAAHAGRLGEQAAVLVLDAIRASYECR